MTNSTEIIPSGTKRYKKIGASLQTRMPKVFRNKEVYPKNRWRQYVFALFFGCFAFIIPYNGHGQCAINVTMDNEVLCPHLGIEYVALSPTVSGAATCAPPVNCSTTILSYSSNCDDPSDCLYPTSISSCLTNVTGVCPTNGADPYASCNANIICISSVFNDWDFSMTAQEDFEFQVMNADFWYPTDGSSAGGQGNYSFCPTSFDAEIQFYVNGILSGFQWITIPENQIITIPVAPSTPIHVPNGSTFRIIINGQPVSQNCDLIELAGLWVNGCCSPSLPTPVEDNTFLWSGPGVNGETDPTVVASTEGTYCVTVTDCNGCQEVECSTVFECNAPPIAQSDINNTLINTSVQGNFVTNDSDKENNPILAITTPVTPPSNGTLTISSNGNYTYTSNPGFVGTDSFEYQISDGIGGSDLGVVFIEVTDVKTIANNKPVANNDYSTTPENKPINLGVLNNDYDPDGDLLSNPSLLSNPPNGTLTLIQNGTITYTPDTGFTGMDNFSYQVCDQSALCHQAFVSIKVTRPTGGNEPPSSIDDVAYTPENTAVTGNAGTNDIEPDGNGTAFTKLSDPSNGTVLFDFSGNYTYTPNSDYNGPDQFTYRICDNGTPSLCDKATVYLLVGSINNQPIAQDDINNTITNIPVNGSLTTNDLDTDNDILTVNSSPLSGPINGTITINPNGTYLYSPNPGFKGIDEITYEVCDTDQLCDIATLYIEIIDPQYGLNIPPVATNDAISTTKNTPVTIAALSNDFDKEGSALIGPTFVSAPSNGNVGLSPSGTFYYTPDLGFIGEDGFEYQICDDLGFCDIASIIITVNEELSLTNTSPTSIDDVVTSDRNSSISSTVALNDEDPDSADQLAYTKESNPSNGTLTFNSDGSYQYTPNLNFYGNDQFTYQVCDDGSPVLCDAATVYFTIFPDNDPPKAFADINTTIVDDNTDGNLLTNDMDINGDGIIVNTTPLIGPFNGTISINTDGSYTYSPNSGFSGTDSLIYTICDDLATYMLCDTGIAKILVVDCLSPGNFAPVAQDDSFIGTEDTPIQANMLRNDYDKDKDNVTLNIPILFAPDNGTLNHSPNGDFEYTPNPGYIGLDEFTYELCDDQTPSLCAYATVYICIAEDIDGNQSPFAGDDAVYTFIDEPITTNLFPNDYDVDGDSIIINTTPIEAPEYGSVLLNTDGSAIYTPISGYSGPDNFVYEICDDGIPVLCTQATFFVIVKPNNDFPIPANDDNNTLKGIPVSGNVLTNDRDPDQDLITLTPTLIATPTNGTVVLDANGEYTYTPNPAFKGEDYFKYEICDDGTPGPFCSIAAVTITVSEFNFGANNKPISNDDDNITFVDVPVSGNVLPNDIDPDGDPLSVNLTLVDGPSKGTATIDANGTYTYTPDLRYKGEDSFVYEICDNNTPVLCDEATVFIRILPSKDTGDNTPPFPEDDFHVTTKDAHFSDNALENDTDPDGNFLKVTTTPVEDPEYGTVILQINGDFLYTPNQGYYGPDHFVYEVCDDASPIACSQATVYILVSPGVRSINPVYDINITFEETPVSGNVGTNDNNPNNNPLIISGFSLTPGGSYTNTLQLPGKGLLTLDNLTGAYTFIPDVGYSGTIQDIEYETCDAILSICETGELTIEVLKNTAVNDAPVGNNDHYQTKENTSFSGISSINDYDPEENTPLVYTKITNPKNGALSYSTDGTFTFIPNTNFTGKDEFDYKVCDPNGLCDQATVFVTIDPGNINNTPPTAVDDAFGIGLETTITNNILLNDPNDPDNDVVRVATIGENSIPDGGVASITTDNGGTVNINSTGAFSYIPATGYFGPDQFVYEVCDDISGCNSATVYILIYNNNRPPFAVNDDNVTFIDMPVSGMVLTNDVDLDGDNLTIATVPINNPTNGTVILNPNGTYTYTPNAGYLGTDHFDYEICDQSAVSLCANARVTINILPEREDLMTNDPPIANDDDNITYINTAVDGNLLPNDYDPEKTALQISGVVTQPTNGVASTLPTGEYTYIPANGFVGKDQFEYLMCDNGTPIECVTANVFIQVLSRLEDDTNLPPVATDDFNYTIIETPISGKLVDNDNDPDNDLIVVKMAEGQPILAGGTLVNSSKGKVLIQANGDYTYTPNPGATGTDQFRYEICDDISGCSKATAYILIEAPDCIELQLKVFLEGAIIDLNSNNSYLQEMRTDLNTLRSILPGQTPVNPLVNPTQQGQPYYFPPFDHAGTVAENNFAGPYAIDIVDWVLVSLRTSPDPTTEFKQAAGLLHADGTISFIEPCILKTTDPGQVYILVEHRNHMGVMTQDPVMVSNGTLVWDFTTQDSYKTITGFGSKQIGQGVYAMFAGDNDQLNDVISYDITGLDKIIWTQQNGNFDQYMSSDYNMNGDTNGSDKILWDNNNGISSRVLK